jgi:hypothetical protein
VPPWETMAQDWPPHAWFAGLESCRDTDYRTFNDSWLEGLEQIEADNDTDQVGQSERQYAIREWLRRPGETEKLKTKTDKIMDVLAGADIQMLRAEKPPLEELTRPVAMLDDRNFATGRARGNRGPQSAFSLYWLLKKKVFSPSRLPQRYLWTRGLRDRTHSAFESTDRPILSRQVSIYRLLHGRGPTLIWPRKTKTNPTLIGDCCALTPAQSRLWILTGQQISHQSGSLEHNGSHWHGLLQSGSCPPGRTVQSSGI